MIIVGATHGATASYRADADRAYAEAIKYTSNVVQVYSPYATWAKVKAAAVGASVVIYLGHGNGWPSPYTYDPNYTTKDGFGLNATYGAGDSQQQVLRRAVDRDARPGAGRDRPPPSPVLRVGQLRAGPPGAERVASPASAPTTTPPAFLKAGASAVIADGHSGAERYLRDLFTTHQSIEDMWRNQSNANGNFVSFASARIAGRRRSTRTPTRRPPGSTDRSRSGPSASPPTKSCRPATATRASTRRASSCRAMPRSRPTAPACTRDLSAIGEPTTTVPAGTRLRVVDSADAATAEGTPLVEVEGLDDPAIAGFMAATDLAAARQLRARLSASLDVGAGRFSPNGDGQGDRAVVRGRFTETVAWSPARRDPAATSCTRRPARARPSRLPGTGSVGGRSRRGRHLHRRGDRPWTPGTTHRRSSSRSIVVDTVAPDLTGLTPSARHDPVVLAERRRRPRHGHPDRHQQRDRLARRPRPQRRRAPSSERSASATAARRRAVTWNGRTNAGATVPDGAYAMSVAPVDLAGNTGEAHDRAVLVIGALRSVVASKSLIFPQDNDGLARSSTLQFSLSRPMEVTWTLRDAKGAVVITRMDHLAPARPARTSWIFDGRRPERHRCCRAAGTPRTSWPPTAS